jgi:signal transduction histidine kinase/ActR/RegA family two-component response regulator
LRASSEGFAPEKTLDGQEVYVAFAHSRLSDWAASIAVSRSVLEGPARHSMLLIASIGLALLALSGLGAFLFSRPLSRSIESSALAADTLARGGRPAVEPSTVAELARLAEALEGTGDLLIQRERELHGHLLQVEAARTQAETASRAKDEFLAMLGHELRNPLGPIRNGVHLLREILPPDPGAERVRGMIERQVTHITRMVDDLLETSRITRGKVLLELRFLDLRGVAREVSEDFRFQFEQARIAFALSLPDEAVWVEGDATRLAQCLGNLLNNALKFTSAGGHVRLTLDRLGDRARLEVQDDGAGLAPGLLPTLFEPFSQGPQALDRGQGGLGLGLALVKGLMDLHGGEVQAHSDGPGLGSRFTLLLPRAVADPTPAEPVKATGRGIRHRILIVEDLRDAAESLEMLLSMDGHDVRIALTGREALAVAPEHRPDLVICDIGLPDIDGYTLCRELRALPALRGATFIALTGYGQADDVQHAYEAGFTVHLTKPVEPARLRQVIAGSEVGTPA